MTYPQPHEYIIGIDRHDDPLMSLDESMRPVRATICALAWHLLMQCSPAVQPRFWERMNKPRIGDLVVEYSTIFHGKEFDGLGYLLGKREEWCHSDEEWAKVAEDWTADGSGPRPHDVFWHIQYGPAPDDVHRWANCRFLAIPAELRLDETWPRR